MGAPTDPQDGTTPETVCILMCTYNGARYLQDQLDSFTAQRHGHWSLLVSDDGSTDATPAILRDFAARMARAGRRVGVVAGPGRGAAANFIALIARAPGGADGADDQGEAGWLALSDQDDVWLPDRLSRGLAALRACPAGRPAMYCSRTWVTDAALGARRASLAFPRPPSFLNALVQNIAPGNTILLNPAAADLARRAAPAAARAADLPAHDWWLYQLIAGHGGTVIHDPVPTLLYRQHGGNEVGANTGWRARWTRLRLMARGRLRRWNETNLAVLEASRAHLSADNRAHLAEFADLRRQTLAARIRRFAASGIHRQTRLGQASLWLAVILGRI